jgi:hypothetical protein
MEAFKCIIKILILVFLLIRGSSLKSQELRFGVFANPLISWMKTDVSAIQNNGSKIGFDAGLMLDKYFTKRYAFATGISIHSMGSMLKYTEGKRGFQTSSSVIDLDNNAEVKYKLQYIHVPLALKFRTTEIGYITYFAQLGLNPMVNIKANADIKSANLTNANVNKEINLFYLAYHISGGIEYKIVGNTAILVGITYMNGFTDITDNGGYTTEKAVMHCFELRLGVFF